MRRISRLLWQSIAGLTFFARLAVLILIVAPCAVIRGAAVQTEKRLQSLQFHSSRQALRIHSDS